MADEETLAKFLSRIAHDLRNSTSLLTLNIDMVAAEATSQRSLECLDDIREALRRLDALSYGLSHTLRPPMGEPEPIALGPVAEDALNAAMERRAAEAAPQVNATLEVSTSESFQAPREMFEIVFGCLFDNALDAIEEKGSGTIRITGDGETIAISNNGPPIPDEVRDHLFEPFVGAPPHSRFRPGLGLARARAAAQRGGASLDLARSDTEETRFVLRFLERE